MAPAAPSLNAVNIIRRKRNGDVLSTEEIHAFIDAATRRQIPEYQTTAFLMATFFQGMKVTETAALTQAMIDSGRRVHFSEDRNDGRDDSTAPSEEAANPPLPSIEGNLATIPPYYVDKHSTGGIGDKISLILAPLVAALDLKVPMVAGRGLGHTGGTLDKLESIPGFSVNLSLEHFKKQVEQTGTAIMGQTADFVPADKLLYALRDVTATVECIPLITASILSKKVAEGISGLVMDLKVGSGAFMKTMSGAQTLAKSLMTVGKALGIKVRVVITDMNQPLGFTVGNSLEVLECLDILEDKPCSLVRGPLSNPQDIRDLTVELAAHMLVIGEKASSLSAGRIMARRALSDGSALKKFLEMCQAQGVKDDLLTDRSLLRISPHRLELTASKTGYLGKMDGEALGLLVVDLGGGRHKAEDKVDPSVGLVFHAKTGSAVKKDAPLVTAYYSPERLAAQGMTVGNMESRIRNALSIVNQKPKPLKLIKKVMQ